MTTPTSTINYAMFWHGTAWPSSTNRSSQGTPALEPTSEMAPQHAAACLAKLLRWVEISPVGVAAGQDTDTRNEYARKTSLGMALAARALGLVAGDELYALYSEATDLQLSAPAATRTVLETVFDVLERTHPLANKADLGRVAGELTGTLVNAYNIRLLGS